MTATALLKVPMLLGFAHCAYYAMTPPTLPPPEKEKRVPPPPVQPWVMLVHTVLGRTEKWTILGLAVGEAALILIDQCASEPVLSHGLSGVFDASHADMGGKGLRLTRSSTAACLLGIAGGLIRRSCHRALGRFFTWEMSIYNGHRLITTGPYRVVRHPSYTGLALLVVGIALLLTSSGSVFVEAGLWDTGFGKALVVVFVAHLSWTAGELLWRTRAEDEMMRAHFGREWEEWAKRTPYRVLPLVY